MVTPEDIAREHRVTRRYAKEKLNRLSESASLYGPDGELDQEKVNQSWRASGRPKKSSRLTHEQLSGLIAFVRRGAGHDKIDLMLKRFGEVWSRATIYRFIELHREQSGS